MRFADASSMRDHRARSAGPAGIPQRVEDGLLAGCLQEFGTVGGPPRLAASVASRLARRAVGAPQDAASAGAPRRPRTPTRIDRVKSPGNAEWAPDRRRGPRSARPPRTSSSSTSSTSPSCGDCRRMQGLLYPAFDFEALLIGMVPVKVRYDFAGGQAAAASSTAITEAPSVLITTPEGRLVFLMQGFKNAAGLLQPRAQGPRHLPPVRQEGRRAGRRRRSRRTRRSRPAASSTRASTPKARAAAAEARVASRPTPAPGVREARARGPGRRRARARRLPRRRARRSTSSSPRRRTPTRRSAPSSSARRSRSRRTARRGPRALQEVREGPPQLEVPRAGAAASSRGSSRRAPEVVKRAALVCFSSALAAARVRRPAGGRPIRRPCSRSTPRSRPDARPAAGTLVLDATLAVGLARQQPHALRGVPDPDDRHARGRAGREVRRAALSRRARWQKFAFSETPLSVYARRRSRSRSRSSGPGAAAPLSRAPSSTRPATTRSASRRRAWRSAPEPARRRGAAAAATAVRRRSLAGGAVPLSEARRRPGRATAAAGASAATSASPREAGPPRSCSCCSSAGPRAEPDALRLSRDSADGQLLRRRRRRAEPRARSARVALRPRHGHDVLRPRRRGGALGPALRRRCSRSRGCSAGDRRRPRAAGALDVRLLRHPDAHRPDAERAGARSGVAGRLRHGPPRRRRRGALRRAGSSLGLLAFVAATPGRRARIPLLLRALARARPALPLPRRLLRKPHRALPRAGAWMESVKKIFGWILLAMAAYFLRSVLPAPVGPVAAAGRARRRRCVAHPRARLRAAAGRVRAGVAALFLAVAIFFVPRTLAGWQARPVGAVRRGASRRRAGPPSSTSRRTGACPASSSTSGRSRDPRVREALARPRPLQGGHDQARLARDGGAGRSSSRSSGVPDRHLPRRVGPGAARTCAWWASRTPTSS